MRKGKKSPSGELGVVVQNVAPLRAEPTSESEQISQALIGQPVTVEGGQKDRLFVQTWDAYRGWIDSRAVRMLEDDSIPYASSGAVAMIRELFVDVMREPNERAGIITKVTIGAQLEVAKAGADWVELKLPDGGSGFIRKQDARLVDKDIAQTIWLASSIKLVETARRFVGVPYLWGGTSPFGLDCSGFVQLVHLIHNITLLRDASMQASDPRGVRVPKKDLRAGDLVFFGKGKESDTSSVKHVGMAIDSKEFIHCCGSQGVTITPLGDPYYSGIYWGARRLRLATLDPGGGAPEE